MNVNILDVALPGILLVRHLWWELSESDSTNAVAQLGYEQARGLSVAPAVPCLGRWRLCARTRPPLGSRAPGRRCPAGRAAPGRQQRKRTVGSVGAALSSAMLEVLPGDVRCGPGGGGGGGGGYGWRLQRGGCSVRGVPWQCAAETSCNGRGVVNRFVLYPIALQIAWRRRPILRRLPESSQWPRLGVVAEAELGEVRRRHRAGVRGRAPQAPCRRSERAAGGGLGDPEVRGGGRTFGQDLATKKYEG